MAQPLDEAATASKKWKEYATLQPRIAVAALRASLHEARKAGAEEFQKRGVGRAIWGGTGVSNSGLRGAKRLKALAKDIRKYIQRERVRESRGRFETGLKVVGIPALVLQGGRSRPFSVEGTPLAWQANGSMGDRNYKGKAFARSAQFKSGVRYQRDDFLRDSRQVLEKAYPKKVEAGQQRALKRMGLI